MQPVVQHCRSPLPRACNCDDDIQSLCAFQSDEERHVAVKELFETWAPGTHQTKVNQMVDALSLTMHTVQQAALQAHERGEDTTDSEQQLWKMVDMVVQFKVLMRELAGEAAPELKPGESSRPKETRIRLDH